MSKLDSIIDDFSNLSDEDLIALIDRSIRHIIAASESAGFSNPEEQALSVCMYAVTADNRFAREELSSISSALSDSFTTLTQDELRQYIIQSGHVSRESCMASLRSLRDGLSEFDQSIGIDITVLCLAICMIDREISQGEALWLEDLLNTPDTYRGMVRSAPVQPGMFKYKVLVGEVALCLDVAWSGRNPADREDVRYSGSKGIPGARQVLYTSPVYGNFAPIHILDRDSESNRNMHPDRGPDRGKRYRAPLKEDECG